MPVILIDGSPVHVRTSSGSLPTLRDLDAIRDFRRQLAMGLEASFATDSPAAYTHETYGIPSVVLAEDPANG